MTGIIIIIAWIGALALLRYWATSSERRWLDVLIVAAACLAIAEVINSTMP